MQVNSPLQVIASPARRGCGTRNVFAAIALMSHYCLMFWLTILLCVFLCMYVCLFIIHRFQIIRAIIFFLMGFIITSIARMIMITLIFLSSLFKIMNQRSTNTIYAKTNKILNNQNNKLTNAYYDTALYNCDLVCLERADIVWINRYK